MDEETRGFICVALDEMIREKGDLLGVLEPFLKRLKIKSFRDFAFGYMIGGAKALGSSLLAIKEIHSGQMHRMSDEERIEIHEMIMERLSDIEERIERELGR